MSTTETLKPETKKRRRIMRSFTLNEVSAVDRAAQPAARMLIAKRDDSEETPADAGSTAEEVGIIDKEPVMANENADTVSAEVKKRDDRIAVLEAVIGLSPAHRAHFDALPIKKQESFLVGTDEQRDAALEAIEKANPVIFTAIDGAEYRKNDDPRLVSMAKSRDDERATTETLRKAHDDAQFAKQADEVFGDMSGEKATKVAMIRKLSEIEDETVRDAALDMLAKANEFYKSATVTSGVSDTVAVEKREGLTAADVLNAAIKKCAEDDKLSIEDATRVVTSTEEGAVLYKAMRDERRSRAS